MAVAVARSVSRHGAVAASVMFHGAALALLILKLTPPILTVPANADIPAVAVEVITLPTPAPDPVTTAAPPPPPPEPEPVVVEEPPPLIESTVAETIAEPPPPPKVEKKLEPKPKAKPVKTPPKPVERPPERVETASVDTTPPPPAPAAQQTAMAAPAGRVGPPPDYLSQLYSALERNKDYPRAAQQRRQQGRAMLRFTIDRSGKVLDYKIEKSTGYEILDQAVVAMIQRASPLPPMPADMAKDQLELLVPVPFTLTRR